MMECGYIMLAATYATSMSNSGISSQRKKDEEEAASLSLYKQNEGLFIMTSSIYKAVVSIVFLRKANLLFFYFSSFSFYTSTISFSSAAIFLFMERESMKSHFHFIKKCHKHLVIVSDKHD